MKALWCLLLVACAVPTEPPQTLDSPIRIGEATDPAPAKKKKAPAPSASASSTPSAPAAAASPFTGAPSFAAESPDTDSADHHLGDTNAGKDCFSCHGSGAPDFAFAGTVQDGANAQIRIVDATGQEIALVNADSAGNFWQLGAITFPAGARVGVRSGTATKTMTEPLTNGSCNQTHCHTREMPITLSSAP